MTQVDEDRIWNWCHNEIIKDRTHAAVKLGFPSIANLDISEKATTPILKQRVWPFFMANQTIAPENQSRDRQGAIRATMRK